MNYVECFDQCLDYITLSSVLTIILINTTYHHF